MAIRLFLHAGPHKTATTTFQTALGQRAEQHGLTVLADDKQTGNVHNAGRLAHQFLRPGLVTPVRLRTGQEPDPATRKAAFAHFAAQLPANGDAILSAEAFSYLRTDAEAAVLHDALDPLVDEIVPLLVRRNKDDWRASFAQLMANRRATDALARVPPKRAANGSWYFNWAALHAFWAGFGEVRVVDYDMALQKEGTVLPAMARALERPEMFAGLEELWLNERKELHPR